MTSTISGYPTPESIRQHPDRPLWTKPWQATHRRNRMYSIIVIGGTGKGKSVFSFSLARFLDINTDGTHRFDLSRVYFETEDFIASIRAKNPTGTAHVMDDAGMNLYNRDAMVKKVKDSIKVAQSMRFKNPIMIYNLPDLDFLDKSIIKLSNLLITVKGYDEVTKLTRITVQFIKKYPNNPNIYYPYPIEVKKIIGMMGIEWSMNIRKKSMFFHMAPKNFVDEYEDMREQAMHKKYEDIERGIRAGIAKDINKKKYEEFKDKYIYKSKESVKNDSKSSTNRSVDDKTTESDVPEELLSGW